MRAPRIALLLLMLLGLPSCGTQPRPLSCPAIPSEFVTPPADVKVPDEATLDKAGWDKAVGYLISDLFAWKDAATDKFTSARKLNELNKQNK